MTSFFSLDNPWMFYVFSLDDLWMDSSFNLGDLLMITLIWMISVFSLNDCSSVWMISELTLLDLHYCYPDCHREDITLSSQQYNSISCFKECAFFYEMSNRNDWLLGTRLTVETRSGRLHPWRCVGDRCTVDTSSICLSRGNYLALAELFLDERYLYILQFALLSCIPMEDSGVSFVSKFVLSLPLLYLTLRS